MISTLYIEESILSHPRTERIIKHFPQAVIIECERYGEVFNPKGQNFRLQKKRPALILAEKFKGHVLSAPSGYGIGGQRNFYFSHMLNCIYDCRYCFLQGMYRSAHYVCFVNFSDFKKKIEEKIMEAPEQTSYFFSGYDCDSLALDSVTGFVEEFVPFFSKRPKGVLELRTKSSQVESLLKQEAITNCVVAFSLAPDAVARSVEHKAPPVHQRLTAINRLSERGWPIGLRFDPLIYCENYDVLYRELFQEVFKYVTASQVHSISFGPMRFPKPMFDSIVKLYPQEPLLAGSLQTRGRMVSYGREIEEEMMEFCRNELKRYAPDSLFFDCLPEAV